MTKLNLSEEERKRRSEHMLTLHKEGRAGAEFGKLGGRPRKRRATEIAAEKIAEKGEYLFTKLLEKIESENEKVSLDAIKSAFALEEQERKTQEGEEIRYDQMRREELVAAVLENLELLNSRGDIELGDIIIAEPVAELEERPTGSVT